MTELSSWVAMRPVNTHEEEAALGCASNCAVVLGVLAGRKSHRPSLGNDDVNDRYGHGSPVRSASRRRNQHGLEAR